MSLTPESQLLQRHLDLFENKNLLFLGNVQDDFPAQCRTLAKQIKVVSYYFDYVRHAKNPTEFTLEAAYQGASLIVFYWGKNKQECLFQLTQILSLAPVGQKMLLVGENRGGVRSAEKFCDELGDIHKIDSARRCSLYYFELQKPVQFALSDWWKQYSLPQLPQLTIYALPGVFSSGELDQGTDLLKFHSPQIDLTMSDIHAMALASATQTLQQNQLQGSVIASDVFSQINDKFDLIISNPPFHSGLDTAYQAVETLITEAKQHLNRGGELRIVANAFLPYPDLLDRCFGAHQVLAKTGKFKVYSVKNA